VVVNAPSNGVYYGNIVAGSVFREISDKLYATNFFRDFKTGESLSAKNIVPEAGNG
jgi:cell division protein FtsI (penicillin-binding protein 3)